MSACACAPFSVIATSVSIMAVNLPAVAEESSVVHHCSTNEAFPMYRMALHPGIHFARLVSLRIPVDVPAVVVSAVDYTVAVVDLMMPIFEHFECFDYNSCGLWKMRSYSFCLWYLIRICLCMRLTCCSTKIQVHTFVTIQIYTFGI